MLKNKEQKAQATEGLATNIRSIEQRISADCKNEHLIESECMVSESTDRIPRKPSANTLHGTSLTSTFS
jgi:hypothetical protein